MILHAAGRYAESNAVLAKAEELADALAAKSVTRETAAALWSEEATEYAGEDFEVVLIPVLRLLNYLALDDWEGALVEVRRIETVTERVYGKAGAHGNPFVDYLSGIVWEGTGHANDALIDYRRAAARDRPLPYLGPDLKALSRRLGMRTKLPPKGATAWEVPKGYRKKEGELVVIVESGRAPHFEAQRVSTGLFTLSAPIVVGVGAPAANAMVTIDGEECGETHPFFVIDWAIGPTQAKRLKKSLYRKMAKLAVQSALYTTGAELLREKEDEERSTEEQIAGVLLIMLGMSMSATEQADVRSWRSLPATFEIARVPLDPGEYDVGIVPASGAQPIEARVTIDTERPALIVVSVPKTGPSRIIAGVQSAKTGLSSKEQTLLAKLEGNPKKGKHLIKEANLSRDRAKAFDAYRAGLVAEGEGSYQQAARDFARAHGMGLVAKPIEEHFLAAYRKCDKEFRKSDEGLALVEQVSAGMAERLRTK